MKQILKNHKAAATKRTSVVRPTAKKASIKKRTAVASAGDSHPIRFVVPSLLRFPPKGYARPGEGYWIMKSILDLQDPDPQSVDSRPETKDSHH